ncbi:MAG: O-antigen ligase family protein [Nitrospiria bacterium]
MGRLHSWSTSRRADLWLLGLLLVCLPILEVPKTIFAVLLILVAGVPAVVRDIRLGRAPDALGWALLAMLGVSIASTAVNWPFPSRLKGSYDTFIYTAVFWTVYRSAWREEEKTWLAGAAVLGVLLGLAWGIVAVWQGREQTLELHSVGVVTHSAIYLGIVLMIAVSLGTLGPNAGRTWLGVSAMLLAGLLLMASRGAILAVAVIGTLVMIRAGRPRLWVGSCAAAAILLLVVVQMPNTFSQHRFLTKMTHFLTTGRLDANDTVRATIWRIGMAQVTQGHTLWLGVGPQNFWTIDVARLAFDPPIDPSRVPMTHPHNLFLTKLTEEGIAGLAALLVFFGLIGRRLIVDRKLGKRNDWTWGAAVGALGVPIIAGSFTTPWYHEHAILAMIWLGLYLAPLPDAEVGVVRPHDRSVAGMAPHPYVKVGS